MMIKLRLEECLKYDSFIAFKIFPEGIDIKDFNRVKVLISGVRYLKLIDLSQNPESQGSIDENPCFESDLILA